MGDRTGYTITIRGTEDDYLPTIGRHLDEMWDATSDDGGGVWWIEELSVGTAGDIAEGLDELMVRMDAPFAYRVDEDPKYEWDGTWIGFIPGLGTASGGVDGGGAQHIGLHELDQLLDAWRAEGPQGDPLAVRLERLTHRGWRTVWDLLDEQDLPEPVAEALPGVSEATIAQARWLADHPLPEAP